MRVCMRRACSAQCLPDRPHCHAASHPRESLGTLVAHQRRPGAASALLWGVAALRQPTVRRSDSRYVDWVGGQDHTLQETYFEKATRPYRVL